MSSNTAADCCSPSGLSELPIKTLVMWLEPQKELSDAAADSTKASEAELRLVAERAAALEQRCTKLESQKDGLARALQDGQTEIAVLQVATHLQLQACRLASSGSVCLFALFAMGRC